MLIYDIQCHYKEYRIINEKWSLVQETNQRVNSFFIDNMCECSEYYSQLGGRMYFNQISDERFGLVFNKITSISICDKVKKVLTFDYDNAIALKNNFIE